MNRSASALPVVVAALVLAAAACNDILPPAPVGNLRVALQTTGGDPDRDGYQVVVDAVDAESMATSGVRLLPNLAEGTHMAELRGAATNCAVDGDNPRSVTIAAFETTEVSFRVRCVATGVTVNVMTAGIDFDADGYGITVDTASTIVVGPQHSVTVTYLSAGSHTVTLSGLSANCNAASASHTVILTVGEVAPVSFPVSCVATTGVIEVTVSTTGLDLDPNGFTAQVGAGSPQPLPPNGRLVLPGLAGGDYSIAIGGAAANCAIAGSNPRSATVRVGGLTRDTTRLSIQISCAAITGAITVSAATAGLDQDSGYTVQVDGGGTFPLQRNASLTFLGLSAGDHVVTLGGLAGNCTSGGGNPRTLTVTLGGATRDTARTTFDVSCVATTGSIEVTAATTGDLDPNGYLVQVDFGSAQSLPVNGTATFNGIAAGDHVVAISGIESNCPVGSPTRVVAVTAGGMTRDTARTTFAVNCVATRGAVRVTAVTSGSDLDPNGYSFRVLGFNFDATQAVASNGAASLGQVPAGVYLVSLGGASGNCGITSANPQAVTIVVGDTVDLAFAIACTPAAPLAVALHVAGNTDIYVVRSNGAGLAPLTTHVASDEGPSWAPGGARIAFHSDRDGNREIYAMNADGSGQVRLTNNAGVDYHPTFSPDGSKIAFLSEQNGNWDIHVMNADGSNVVRLTTHAATDADPVWSPDGLKIAFSSLRDGNSEIYVMNADGTNQVRLTTNQTDDVQPDWSPDGSKIVFSRLTWCYYYDCDYDLVVMNADGSGQTPLPSSWIDTDPAWSPDGQWIAFGARYCDYYYGCWAAAVLAIRPDGTGLYEITPGAWHPAWKR